MAAAEGAGEAVEQCGEAQRGCIAAVDAIVIAGQVRDANQFRQPRFFRFAGSAVEGSDDLEGVAGVTGIDAQTGEGLAFNDLAIPIKAFHDQVELYRSGYVIFLQSRTDPALQFHLVGRRIDPGHALAQDVGRRVATLHVKHATRTQAEDCAEFGNSITGSGIRCDDGLQNAGLCDAHAQDITPLPWMPGVDAQQRRLFDHGGSGGMDGLGEGGGD